MPLSAIHRKTVGDELAAIFDANPAEEVPWYKRPRLLRLNIHIFFLLLYASANGYDGSMMNGLQALTLWHKFMNYPTGSWLGFITAAQSLGATISIFAMPSVVNRFGRKKGLYFLYLWLALGVSIQTAAQNPAMFVLGRIFVGVASAALSVSAPTLITEIAYPTHRGIVTGMYNCGWYVGSLLAAWSIYGTRNYTTSWAWRVPSILQIAIPLFSLPSLIFTPESPRWLIDHGRIAEAKDFLVTYHGGGDPNSPVAAFELQEIQRTLEMEKHAQKATSYLTLFKTKGNRHRSFISITVGIYNIWNGVGIVSFYLPEVLAGAGITSVTDQTLILGCLQIWNLILAVTAACLVDRVGRRRLWLFSGFGMLVAYICITGLSGGYANTGNISLGIAFVPFLFIYFGFYDSAFTPLAVAYPVEIWPYALRARGVALTTTSAYLSMFFNVFVNPIALQALQWKYYLVYVAIIIIMIANIWFYYPETRGHTLEEIARVFDKNEDLSGQTPDPVQVMAETQGKESENGSEHIEKGIYATTVEKGY